ncbi:hypothetical protein JCM16496A_02500 [Bacteroides rodentium JCM 16496]
METLRKQYAYARSLQGEKKYDEAIQAYKICLNIEAKEQSTTDVFVLKVCLFRSYLSKPIL